MILCVLFLSIFILSSINDLNSNQRTDLEVEFVYAKASEVEVLLPSYNPIVFHSGSDKLHLLFQHEVREGDAVLYKYYHMYELENESWSQPRKLKHPNTALSAEYELINPTESGMDIYYQVETLNGEFLHKIQYKEQSDMWFDPIPVFSKDQVYDFLNLSNQELVFTIISYTVLNDDSFIVIWRFSFDENNLISHPFENDILCTKVFENGTLSIYPPSLPKKHLIKQSMPIIGNNSQIFLYNKDFSKRLSVLSNGTWSNWQDSGLNGEEYKKDYKFLVNNRYLAIQTTLMDVALILLDLAAEHLSTNEITLPQTPYWGLNIILDQTSEIELKYIVSIVTNSTVELWRFDRSTSLWNHISTLNHSISEPCNLRYYNLIFSQDKLILFLDQRINQEIYEIFSISYDFNTDTWSQVTQLTDASSFTDDNIDGKTTTSFSFVISVIALLVGIFLKGRRI